MNYDHLNKISEHLTNDLLPNFRHLQTVPSFDEYLKRFSFLPHGRWIRDLEMIKFGRNGFAVDSIKFAEMFKDKCVTYNAPGKPEDGIQRVVYQFTPKVHAEAAFWAWIEHDQLFYYASLFFCYGDEEEFAVLAKKLWEIRQQGNTEEKAPQTGFGGFMGNVNGQQSFRQ